MKPKYSSVLTCLYIAALFTLMGLQPVKGQVYFKTDSGKKRVTLPFDFVRNMIIVHVIINNKGPYNFILDTGVGLMIITDPSLVDSLNIKNKRLIKIAGLGEGKDFEAYVAPSVKVQLPGITGDNISAAILKKDDFGLSNYAGMHIHGLLGYEFFDSFAVRINFSDTTLTVGLPKDIRTFKRGDKLPLTIQGQKPYITTKIKINDGRQNADEKLILDLGAGHSVSLENFIRDNNGLPDKFIASDLGISLTGPIHGFLSRVNVVEMGKYRLNNVIASFPEYDSVKNNDISVKRDGNIGMEILKKFDMIIDYKNSVMYLKPNNLFKQTFECDMSGLEYYAEGKDFKSILISKVERGSAAAEIGLQKGDEIIAINLKAVHGMKIAEIDDLFRSRTDKSILLLIYHDKQYDKVILTLKRRI